MSILLWSRAGNGNYAASAAEARIAATATAQCVTRRCSTNRLYVAWCLRHTSDPEYRISRTNYTSAISIC